MQTLFYELAVLACPVGMGAMMWMMMRGKRRAPGGSDPAGGQQQVDQLRAEIDELRTERATQRAQGPN